MKHIKTYKEINEGLFSSFKRSDDQQIIIDFICNVMNKIISGESNLQSQISLYHRISQSRFILYDTRGYNSNENKFYIKADNIDGDIMTLTINIKGEYFDNENNPIKNPLDPYGEENWRDEDENYKPSEDFVIRELKMRGSNELYRRAKILHKYQENQKKEEARRIRREKDVEEMKKVKDAADFLKKRK